MSELVLDRYEVLKPLAQGGMGEVLLARQTGMKGFERIVVLKSLRADLADDQNFVEQFLNEARVAATLSHPNIVQIFEASDWGNVLYLVMEYIEGADLSRIWYAAAKRGLGLPFHLTVKVIHDAALGLDHAHKARDVQGHPQNIVHRDVSPQNIMVRRDGVVKLIDFGIAKAKGSVSSTTVGTVKGKLQYMSPEHVKGEPLDGRSDQFSLGIVLWEMCTGKRLFKAESEIATLNKVLSHPIPPPSSIVTGFPVELEAIMMRMLERDRDRRFSSCGEAARELKTYLDRLAKSGRDLSPAPFLEDVLGEEFDERAAELQALARNPAKRSDNSKKSPSTSTAKPAPVVRDALIVSTRDGTEIEFSRLDDIVRAARDGKIGQFDLFHERGKPPVALGADARFAPVFAPSAVRPLTNPRGATPILDAPDGGTSAWTPPKASRVPSSTNSLSSTPITRAATTNPRVGIATDLGIDDDLSDFGVRKSRTVPVMIGLIFAFVVVGGTVVAVDNDLRASLLRVVGQPENTMGQLAFDEAKGALNTDRPTAIDAALSSLQGEGVVEESWRARLLSSKARIDTERARLAALVNDEARTQSAQAAADLGRAAAYRAATNARARGESVVDARIALASYHALRGAPMDMGVEMKAAEALAAPETRDDVVNEQRVLVALLEAQRALQAPDDESKEPLARALVLLEEAERERTSVDVRVGYAKAAVLVEMSLFDPSKSDAARAATNGLKGALAGDERILLLGKRLDTVKPAVATTKPDDKPAPSPATKPDDDEPTASPDELLREADRARERGLTYKAVGIYRKALKARASFPRAYVGLGWAYIDLGKNDDAIRVFDRAMAIDGKETEALFGMAEAHRYSGDKESARRAYKSYLAADPTGSDANVAKGALRALGGD